ncbi:MAG: DUF4258 domain-containing protein [Solirubrobacterales bacterium]
MGYRFSRHARNRLRALGISRKEVELLVASTHPVDRDLEGRPRHEGEVDGVPVRVVVAVDRPDLIVTVYGRSR